MPKGTPAASPSTSSSGTSRSGAQAAPLVSAWKASTISASPASTASGSPKARWTEGRPRRVAASSKQGRSSWTREAQCSSSIAAAAASATPGGAPPLAAATARQSRGRTRAPPGNTAWCIAWARSGGQPAVVESPTAAARVRSIRVTASMPASLLPNRQEWLSIRSVNLH